MTTTIDQSIFISKTEFEQFCKKYRGKSTIEHEGLASEYRVLKLQIGSLRITIFSE